MRLGQGISRDALSMELDVRDVVGAQSPRPRVPVVVEIILLKIRIGRIVS